MPVEEVPVKRLICRWSLSCLLALPAAAACSAPDSPAPEPSTPGAARPVMGSQRQPAPTPGNVNAPTSPAAAPPAAQPAPAAEAGPAAEAVETPAPAPTPE